MKSKKVDVIQKHINFFSENPPVTVLEDLQIEKGYSLAIQPRDITFVLLLQRLQVFNPRRVLDFGCANGIWLERLLCSYTRAKGMGVDISQRLIEEADLRKTRKASYSCSRNTWDVPENYFDFVYSLDTFEHVLDKKRELKRIYESMVPGGKFLFYTLNPRNAFTFDWLFEKLGSDYLYRRADHEKSCYYDPRLFQNDLEQIGMKDVSFMLYDGPVNLFWHVFCYTYLGVLEKVFRFLHVQFLLRWVLQANDFWLRLIYPVSSFLDSLVFRTGNSNGYFIWGEKQM
jgi:2-polyprenyl-3-methyl-5-hydroxy-6-metoxy-1,4-benzoquinol methylase